MRRARLLVAAGLASEGNGRERRCVVFDRMRDGGVPVHLGSRARLGGPWCRPELGWARRTRLHGAQRTCLHRLGRLGTHRLGTRRLGTHGLGTHRLGTHGLGTHRLGTRLRRGRSRRRGRRFGEGDGSALRALPPARFPLSHLPQDALVVGCERRGDAAGWAERLRRELRVARSTDDALASHDLSSTEGPGTDGARPL